MGKIVAVRKPWKAEDAEKREQTCVIADVRGTGFAAKRRRFADGVGKKHTLTKVDSE